MTEMAQNFTKETCMPNISILLNVDVFGPYWGHVPAKLGPCFGYFYNIYASRYMTMLKFSLESQACKIEEYSTMLTNWGHIGAMFWPY